ncbi:hypothetical protein HAX54_021700 [Datura stramonium]|uniref:Uncharacterized protein n=1 Tax=Datura stramonium TaxID=4076 RepID=A0ABS8UV77_DATST|nr:hypothetical protein [Datura stramonium]
MEQEIKRNAKNFALKKIFAIAILTMIGGRLCCDKVDKRDFSSQDLKLIEFDQISKTIPSQELGQNRCFRLDLNVVIDFSNEEDFNFDFIQGSSQSMANGCGSKSGRQTLEVGEDLPIAQGGYASREMDNAKRKNRVLVGAKVRSKSTYETTTDAIWVGLKNEDSPLRGYTRNLSMRASQNTAHFVKNLDT